MAFNELKQNLKEADDKVHSYLKNSEAYIHLKSFKMAMLLVTAFAQALLVGGLVLVTLFILAIAASYGLGQLLHNTFYGFAIVGIFALIVSIVAYVLRKKINKPIIRKFSATFFR